MSDLYVTTWGEGEPVVFVHGDVTSGSSAFRAQQPLTERWKLIVPDRRNYGGSPDALDHDFEDDARDIAELLGDGAHLVGHSYGGMVAMYVAGWYPESVWSLTLVEPAAFDEVKDHPAIRDYLDRMEVLFGGASGMTPEEFLAKFLVVVGGDPSRLPNPLSPSLRRHTIRLMTQRHPWEATPPYDAIVAARIPTLAISGGHAEVFEVMCDHVTTRLNAERDTLPGAGHNVASLGEPFNQRLERFWKTVSVNRARS